MLNVNEYFDGKVKSIGFQTDSKPATVGVMVAGDYTFSTSQKETMTVVSGKLIVKLPGDIDWKTFTDNQSFIVAADTSFDLQVPIDTAYLCVYG